MAQDAIYEEVALARVLHGPAEICVVVEEATGSSSDFRFGLVVGGLLLEEAASTRASSVTHDVRTGRC
jgi:hypothetical protein